MPAAMVNNKECNGEVYNNFYEAFLEHFCPQVRTHENSASDELYGPTKSYKQKTDESVGLRMTCPSFRCMFRLSLR